MPDLPSKEDIDKIVASSGSFIPPSHVYGQQTFTAQSSTGRIEFDRPILRIVTSRKTQAVDLSKLQSAIYIPQFALLGNTFMMNRPCLELTDDYHPTLTLYFRMFDTEDIDTILDCIRPFVIKEGVTRNFTDLPKLMTHRVVSPPLIPWHKALIGGALYVLLPAIVITAIILLVAYLTNQPGLRF